MLPSGTGWDPKYTDGANIKSGVIGLVPISSCVSSEELSWKSNVILIMTDKEGYGYMSYTAPYGKY